MTTVLAFLIAAAALTLLAGLVLFALWFVDRSLPPRFEMRLTDTPSDLDDDDLPTTTINGRDYCVRNNIVVDDGSSRVELPGTPPDLE